MSTTTLPVPNLILRSGSVLEPNALVATEPTATFSELVGHYALHLGIGETEELLARDALGVNKLFFAIGPSGIESANYFVDLVHRGFQPRQIWSVPSGHLIRIQPEQRQLKLEKYSTLSFADDAPAVEAELPQHAARIGADLESTFRDLRGALSGRPLYVTLSGGLDSTTIAALAREHIGPFVAVTFAAREPTAGDESHSDLHYARRVAAELGVPLEVVEVSPATLPDWLDEVLLYGQDFRDFNVHCGLVNAVLAKAIARMPRPEGSGRPCVLTGDTMNELVADYTPVQYGDSEYYSLPNLTPGRLRRFLVSGLDTGDREVGLFARQGIDTVQPYALCAQAYASLPGGFLNDDRAKQTLVRLMMGDRVPSFIYDRPKVRAQVADSNQVGGTMAALLDRGIDSKQLEQRFCELLGFDTAELKRWIRGGLYRFTSSYPESN